MTIYYQDDQTTVYRGDCIEVMRNMPENSVDSIVTDPPYGLGFMGAKWDALPPGKDWAEECLRVLKPGGHLLAFGGTRTWHRLAVAIEDAGFEIRDSVMWLYGSGFPKSHDVSKAIDKLDASDDRQARALEFTAFIRESGLTARRIDELTGTNMGGHFTTSASQPRVATADLFDLLRPHLPEVPERTEKLVRQRTVESQNFKSREVIGIKKGAMSGWNMDGTTKFVAREETAPATSEAAQWSGWGTALKPANEPIVMARKPFKGTVAANVLEHGTGALNIDACRIGTDEKITNHARGAASSVSKGIYGDSVEQVTHQTAGQALGRWPANVILDEHMAGVLDEQSGPLHTQNPATRYRASDPAWSPSGTPRGTHREAKQATGGDEEKGLGASRFFYVAKAPKRERPEVNGVKHATVKPLALMRYLVRMVTPPNGIVLDPFAGSGTTIEAALLEGFQSIGIELTDEYLPLIQQRIQRQWGLL